MGKEMCFVTGRGERLSKQRPHKSPRSTQIKSSICRVHEEEVSAGLLFPVLDAVALVDSRSEVGGVSSEGDAQ